MKMSLLRPTPLIAAAVTAAIVTTVPAPGRASASARGLGGSASEAALLADSRLEVHAVRLEDGALVCGEALPDEAERVAGAAAEPELHTIYAGRASKGKDDVGLTIVLYGTAQLEQYPNARDAYVRAAQVWEDLIKSPVTLNIAVDFGPTYFGQAFDPSSGGYGSWYSQTRPYTEVRAALVAGASSPEELALYQRLPETAVPTSAGTVTTVTAPHIAYRALGLLNPRPDVLEQTRPKIGYRNVPSFDLDSSNGIDAGKIDFTGSITHQIGHLLGFTSQVGDTELHPATTPSVSLLDLFRFRAGATLDGVGTGERLLKAGGNQVFFDGGPELPLSTGRADGTGGDARQPDHWQDSRLNGGRYVGIMDPGSWLGEVVLVTDDDLRAMDLFGYRFTAVDGPSLGALTAHLSGDVLTVAGTFSDVNNDVVSARVTLLDAQGAVVQERALVGVAPSSATEFSVDLDGLGAVPAAVRVTLVLIDGTGNESRPRTAEFGQADAGGPGLTKATFKNNKLKLKGAGFLGTLGLEVNGVALASTVAPNPAGTGAKVSASASALGLHSGANRVVVTANGLRSNVYVITL